MSISAGVSVLGRTSTRWLLSVRLLQSQKFGVGNARQVGWSARFQALTGFGKRQLSMATLETLKFDNRALKSLPIDEEERNFVRTVPGACFSRISPTPVKRPDLVAHSQPALDLLGLASSEVARPEFVEYFSGNRVLPGSEPAAHCYCGHQFGYFSGQLGDGCALLLGEVVNGKGERWELQLKGSGKTPYSRHADGRKVLRSSIREFLCSEALHHLGVPTTRSGSCITSDDRIARDIFYNGNVIHERITIISRIAPTFLRFGSFEIFKPRDSVTGRAGPSVGREDILHQLLDYTTQNFYPEVHAAHPEDRKARTAALFSEVCQKTATLVAGWQCVGFCHGVLNTDNMSIVGLTIDYGPFGFMDRYDPGHVCNGSDDGARYAYNRQQSVCHWNLAKLAEAFSPCLDKEQADEILKLYDAEFERLYLEKMRLKLGLLQKQLPDDSDLVESFLDTMHQTGCDFTNGFRCLSELNINSAESELKRVSDLLLEQCATPQELVKAFRPKMSARQLFMFAQLMQQSPETMLQLGLSPETLQVEISKLESIDRLKSITADKKMEDDRKLWLAWLKNYRSRLVLETEGLSDDKRSQVSAERLKAMQQNNPRFVLRNHIAQKAIEMAEQGDYSEVHRVLELLHHPYSPPTMATSEATPDMRETGESQTDSAATAMVAKSPAVPDNYDSASLSNYFEKPPEWAVGLCVT